MERKLYTPEAVAALLSSGQDNKNAEIANLIASRPYSVQTIRIALDTEGSFTSHNLVRKVGFPFKSFWVNDASDANVVVLMKVNTNDELQSSFPIRKNDAAVSTGFFSDAFFSWTAQSGKFLEITIFTDAEYRSGSQISVTNGGVTLSDGSTVSAITSVNLVAATAAIIIPALATRKCATYQNQTGADLWVSGSSAVTDTGATQGIKLAADSIGQFRNTGALYGYSVAGGRVNRFEEE